MTWDVAGSCQYASRLELGPVVSSSPCTAWISVGLSVTFFGYNLEDHQPVLQPSPSDVRILLVDDMFYVLTQLLDLICHQNAGDSASDREHLDLAVLGITG